MYFSQGFQLGLHHRRHWEHWVLDVEEALHPRFLRLWWQHNFRTSKWRDHINCNHPSSVVVAHDSFSYIYFWSFSVTWYSIATSTSKPNLDKIIISLCIHFCNSNFVLQDWAPHSSKHVYGFDMHSAIAQPHLLQLLALGGCAAAYHYGPPWCQYHVMQASQTSLAF